MPYISVSLLSKSIGVKGVHFDSFEETQVKQQKDGETFTQTQIVIPVRPYKRLSTLCPSCMKKCPGYDTKQKPSSWRALDYGGIPVILSYAPTRISCPEHGIKTEYLPWSDGNTRFVPAFNNEVTFLALNTSRTVISEYLGINWRTVGNCIKACHDRLEPDVSIRLKGVRRICVDETSIKKRHNYITVVCDLDANQVIWMHENHGYEVFRLFCLALDPADREALEIVAGDGASWIDQCVDEFFPNAVRCIDPFHVVMWITKALDDTRIALARKATKAYQNELAEAQKEAEQLRQEWLDEFQKYKAAVEAIAPLEHKRGRRSTVELALQAFVAEFEEKYGAVMEIMAASEKGALTPEQQKHLDELEKKSKCIKGCKYALSMNPENLSEFNAEKLELIKISDPELYKAYQLKEELRLIVHMKDSHLADEELTAWIEKAKNSEFKPFVNLSEKIERHKENILNSIKYGANSAKSEQTNGVIKGLIKTACGFRSLDNMFALIYLRCSDLVIPLENRYRPSKEKLQEAREKAKKRRQKRLEAMKNVPADN